MGFSLGELGTMASSMECIVGELVDFTEYFTVESEIFPSYDPNIFMHVHNGDSGPIS